MTIYLMIKQCSHCKLKYFCKTTQTAPRRYKGSGKHWINHHKKHNKPIIKTLELHEFDNHDEATEFAITFSYAWNIVESKEWANEKIENALDGGSVKGTKHNRTKPAWNKGKVFVPRKEILSRSNGEVSQAIRDKISDTKQNKEIFTFYHPIHGEFIGTRRELIKKYNQKMQYYILTKMIKGEMKRAWGWTISY